MLLEEHINLQGWVGGGGGGDQGSRTCALVEQMHEVPKITTSVSAARP